jgi:hypothetical protein
MNWTHVLTAASFAFPVTWSAYEAYRMRRHRMKTDLMLSLTACVIQKLDRRLTMAVENDRAIAQQIAEMTRPKKPA